MGVHDFPILKIGLMGAINHCFNNKSQTDPSPCVRKEFQKIPDYFNQTFCQYVSLNLISPNGQLKSSDFMQFLWLI